VREGGSGTIVRRARADSDGLTVTQEAALLDVVRRVSPLPVPEVYRVWPDRDDNHDSEPW
jgi:hypothetical protein